MKRIQLPQDWFRTPTWPPWRHVKTLFRPNWQYCCHSAIAHWGSLIVWITYRFWATYRKVLDKNRVDLMASRLRFRQSNRKREIETRCHLSRLLVSETRHVKKNDLWSQELRVSFPCNFRIVLCHQNGLELMCMFVFIDADSWDVIVHDSASDLLCMKKELGESLLKKESAIKNCHKFFSKKIHFRFQVYKKDKSQLRSTHSVWF